MKYLQTGKICVLTGATSRLGAGIATYFTQLQCTLVLVSNDANANTQVKKMCLAKGIAEDKIYVITTDMCDDVKAEIAFKRIAGVFRRIDILINVGGDIRNGSLANASSDEIAEVFKENVTSVTMAIKHAVPYMRPEGDATSAIINISNICSRRMIEGYFPFGLAKSALDYVTKTSALELAPQKIRVNSVSAGIPIAKLVPLESKSKSEETAKVQEEAQKWNPLGYPCSVDDIAHAISYLAHDESSFISGDIMNVDSGRSVASIL